VSTARILQLVASTDRRGAEVFAVDLQEALHGRGYAIDTVALAPGRGLDLSTLGDRPLAPRTLLALRRAARSASLVIAHGSTTLPASVLALVGRDVPFVYRNIGDPSYWAASTAHRARVRVLLRRAAAVVAVAPPAARRLSEGFGVPDERLVVIPTGVPARRCPLVDPGRRQRARAALGLPPSDPAAAIVGALSPEKNVALAIDAVGESPPWHLVVAGDGPERTALEAHAAAAGSGRIRFTGSLADPGPAYEAADVVLLTSRTEGLPAVLIEAGLRGLPVVATNVGFVNEIVVDGQTGVLVSAGDAHAIARGLAQALQDARALGRAGRARCQRRFELEDVAARWDTLLQRVARRAVAAG
jgi:glycosyltransferase involved in cell wall biosynthesis